jgi:hypothetical protein
MAQKYKSWAKKTTKSDGRMAITQTLGFPSLLERVRRGIKEFIS